MIMDRFQLLLEGQAETAKLGKALGESALPGDLVYLDGGLGAGKTTLTRSIGVALGIAQNAVTSPTYTLVHEYLGGRIPLYHFDLYRLKTSKELEHLGFDDYVRASDGLLVIEWARNAVERLPEDALTIQIAMGGEVNDSRWTSIHAGGERSRALLGILLRTLNC